MKQKVVVRDGLPCFFSIFNQHNGFFNPDFSQTFNNLNSNRPFEKGGNFDINLDDEGLVFLYDNFRDTYNNNNPLDKAEYCFIIKVTSKTPDSFYKYKYQFTPVVEKSLADLSQLQGRTDSNKFLGL